MQWFIDLFSYDAQIVIVTIIGCAATCILIFTPWWPDLKTKQRETAWREISKEIRDRHAVVHNVFNSVPKAFYETVRDAEFPNLIAATYPVQQKNTPSLGIYYILKAFWEPGPYKYRDLAMKALMDPRAYKDLLVIKTRIECFLEAAKV